MRTAGNSEESVPWEVLAQDGARATGPALEAHYCFLLWLVPGVERLPCAVSFLDSRLKMSGMTEGKVGNDRGRMSGMTGGNVGNDGRGAKANPSVLSGFPIENVGNDRGSGPGVRGV